MVNEFHQTIWDDRLRQDCEAILQLAIAEDLGTLGDVTSMALVDVDRTGRAAIVARQAGVVAGLPGVGMILARVDQRICWSPEIEDGQSIERGKSVGIVEGPARGLLAAERTMLNLLGRLSGIATLTRRYVDAVAGTKAHIYDTRKTTPGWRRLEKYAVRCGGGWNHRGGLDQAVLIKDNHLAIVGLAEAVLRARHFVEEQAAAADMPIEVEVDSLAQLDSALSAHPDLVLLDNMSPDQLCQAVDRRDAVSPAVVLEASGGVSLETIRAIALSGVDRISVGALTHSAAAVDFGLDWIPQLG